MLVNVIGMGYIGLPTALMMASHGVNVIGTDYNAERINELNHGGKAFEEKGLAELFEAARAAGIRFSEQYRKADVYIVSVPTPYIKQTRKIDPHYVVTACQSVLDICDDNAILVVESTISPGTIDKFVRPLLNGRKIRLAHAPERIIPGNMLRNSSITPARSASMTKKPARSSRGSMPPSAKARSLSRTSAPRK